MRRITAITLLCWCAVACARPAAASDRERTSGGDSLCTYKFEEVVVYGKRPPQPPSMITEIDTAIIQARNGFDVAGILREEPGLYVSTGAKGDTRTGIRGFDAADILVLVDGYPVNTGYYGKVDLSMFPAGNISTIKVIKGPASTAYGANGMGGIINIITRSSFEKPLTRVTTEAGADNFYRLNLFHGRSRGRLNYSLFAYRRHSDGFRLSDSFNPTPYEDGGVRENSHYMKTGASAKLGLNYSERVRLGLGVGYHSAERGCPPSVSPLEIPRYSEFPEWERFNINLNGDFDLSATVTLRTVAFVNSQSDRYINYNTAEMSMDDLFYDSLLENWTAGGSLKFHIEPADGLEVKTGAAFLRDLMNKKPDVDEKWYSHRNYTFSLFGELSYLPREGTSLTAGLATHLFSSESFSDFSSYLSPMFSLSQNLTGRLKLYGSWANSVRFPNMHQLYSSTSGNESLQPEEADKIEVGLKRSFFSDLLGSGSIELVWFDNSLRNLIYRATRTYVYENIEDAALRGLEGRVSWSPVKYLSINSSYALMNEQESSDELLQEVPAERFSLELLGRTDFGSRAHFSFNRYLSMTTYIESLDLPDYDLYNFSFSQELPWSLRLNVRVNNIFDTNYREELGFPGPGRQVLGGITWTM